MNKEIAVVTLTAAAAALALNGCAVATTLTLTNSAGHTYNQKYNEKCMVTLSGEKKDLDDSVSINKAAGIGFVRPEEWSSLADEGSLMVNGTSPLGTQIVYIPSESLAKLDTITDDMSEDEAYEIYNDAYDYAFPLALIYRLNPNDVQTDFDESVLTNYGLTSEELFSAGDNTYKIAYITEVPEKDYTDLDVKEIKLLINSISTLKDNTILFAPVSAADSFKVNMTSFTTTDLDGNEVTEDIFKDYDVTMVNVWETGCQYCVEEMPALEKLYEGLGDNVNIIGICVDGDSENELAKELVSKTGAKFRILVPNDEITQDLQENVTGFPTTFFVDREGRIVGSVMSGAPGTDEQTIVDTYTALINEALGNN